MTETENDCDVLVAGAGPAGLTAACLLAQGGVKTICVGPNAGAGDTRTTALFGGSERLLKRLGAAKALAGRGAPLRKLRIVDRLEATSHPSALVFTAREAGLESFGTNYRNIDLLAAMEGVAARLPTLSRMESVVWRYEHETTRITAKLDDGAAIATRLVVAADGRGSLAREASGISANSWDYGQCAIAFQVSHRRPHQDTSIEVHKPGGPLTFIPLPGDRSAVNWLAAPDEAKTISKLDDAEFCERLESVSGIPLGSFSDPGPRAIFPISGLSVGSMANNRTVLVGEAAHVLPPIGAQGLNLGFRDGATIAGLAIEAVNSGDDPGEAMVLARYRSARARDVMTRAAATDLLNRSLLFGGAAIAQMRGLGLVLLASSAAARRTLVREGLVRDDDLPDLMRETATIA